MGRIGGDRNGIGSVPTSLTSLLQGVLTSALGVLLAVGLWGLVPAAAAQASLTSNSYDGNIYALYAGNGSLVPPRSSLAQALADHRPAVVIYYLDDDAASKQFSAVVSELQRVWLNSIELIPLVTDPLQNRGDGGPTDPAHYWRGLVPQVVVFNAEGRVIFDEQGAVDVDAINAAVSQATGIPLPEGGTRSSTESFNELNSEVVSR
ncbi:thylakoid membrane photosystem I accumulation factor [Cyanobium sp. FACHB-13342]|nr:thylakoid membrane photosystem I accumulation factor [Cyanobium sp. FACHB-13342]MBD2423005.1 thylakoid membrane photosystem I accumulation factor [Cyanobium sp. FACHB-13342]